MKFFSKSHRRNISKSAKKLGHGKWMRGRTMSATTKKKISLTMKKRYEDNPELRVIMGQKTTERYNKIGRKTHKRYKHQGNSKEYKEWRNKVFTRDNFTCQMCYNIGVYLEAHHIVGYSESVEKRYEVSNGVCLCRKCHMKLTKLQMNGTYFPNFFSGKELEFMLNKIPSDARCTDVYKKLIYLTT